MPLGDQNILMLSAQQIDHDTQLGKLVCDQNTAAMWSRLLSSTYLVSCFDISKNVNWVVLWRFKAKLLCLADDLVFVNARCLLQH